MITISTIATFCGIGIVAILIFLAGAAFGVSTTRWDDKPKTATRDAWDGNNAITAGIAWEYPTTGQKRL